MQYGLYVVGTPIGNLGDMSPHAVDVLRGVDLVAACVCKVGASF